MTGRAPLPYDFMSAVPSFELRSDDVADGQMMPERAGSQPGEAGRWASSHGDMSSRWRLSGEVCAG
jgi:hypothetical protein